MRNTPLPVLLRIEDGHETITDGQVERLLSAMLEDWETALGGRHDVQPWIFSASRRRISSPRLPCWPPDLPAPQWDGEHAQLSAGLLVAADAVALPSGYLQVAIDALNSGICARVSGATISGAPYLLGWGPGAEQVTLPTWYRLLEPGGLHYARRDLRTGCLPRETASALEAIFQDAVPPSVRRDEIIEEDPAFTPLHIPILRYGVMRRRRMQQ